MSCDFNYCIVEIEPINPGEPNVKLIKYDSRYYSEHKLLDFYEKPIDIVKLGDSFLPIVQQRQFRSFGTELVIRDGEFGRFGNAIFSKEFPTVIADFSLNDCYLRHFLSQQPNFNGKEFDGLVEGWRNRNMIVKGCLEFFIKDQKIKKTRIYLEENDYSPPYHTFYGIPSWEDVSKLLFTFGQTRGGFYIQGIFSTSSLPKILPFGWKTYSKDSNHVAFGPLATKKVVQNLFCSKNSRSLRFIDFDRQNYFAVMHERSSTIGWKKYVGLKWTWHYQHAQILSLLFALFPLSLPSNIIYEIICWIDLEKYSLPRFRIIKLIDAVCSVSIPSVVGKRK